MKFTRLSVRDPGINNIEAISLLIPAGWKAEGGIQWFHEFRILVDGSFDSRFKTDRNPELHRYAPPREAFSGTGYWIPRRS
jgi:hypothetical protein